MFALSFIIVLFHIFLVDTCANDEPIEGNDSKNNDSPNSQLSENCSSLVHTFSQHKEEDESKMVVKRTESPTKLKDSIITINVDAASFEVEEKEGVTNKQTKVEITVDIELPSCERPESPREIEDCLPVTAELKDR
jgi:hypothetical protein